MAFAASLPVCLHGFSQPGSRSGSSRASLSARVAQFALYGSVKSAVFGKGFLPQTQTVRSFASKGGLTPGVAYAAATTEQTVYDFTVKDIDGNYVSLSKYRGKVLLVVNVASKCGLTTSNYAELSKLYKFKDQGF